MQKVTYSFSKFFQGYVSKNAQCSRHTWDKSLVFQDSSLDLSKLRGLIATIKRFIAFHKRANQITCLDFFFFHC